MDTRAREHTSARSFCQDVRCSVRIPRPPPGAPAQYCNVLRPSARTVARPIARRRFHGMSDATMLFAIVRPVPRLPHPRPLPGLSLPMIRVGYFLSLLPLLFLLLLILPALPLHSRLGSALKACLQACGTLGTADSCSAVGARTFAEVCPQSSSHPRDSLVLLVLSRAPFALLGGVVSVSVFCLVLGCIFSSRMVRAPSVEGFSEDVFSRRC